MQKKTWAAGITTAAIVTTTLAAPGIAQAQPGTTTLSAVGSPLLSTRSWAPFDNDALFSEFVNRLFYGGPFVSFYSTSGHDQLSGLALEVYDALHDEITLIALGEHTSTKDIRLPKHTWTLEELGIEYNGQDTDFGPATTLYSDAISRALDALLDDCPYELYWYDKTGDNGGGTQMLFSISCDSIEVTLTPSVSMGVALDYRADPANAYNVDGTDAQRALKARVKAQEIVTKNENKSDYEKLNAYRDAICELVSYDDEAADPSTQTPYGDPWQIVSVFDGEGETKVVCEGYAKAFQYLCDLSHFNSNIRCTTVHGVMDGGTGAGNHMWNVIRMGDGRTYLVDVTNSDTGTIGQDGGLFIENYDRMIGNGYRSGYVFRAGGADISYVYDYATLNLYPADYLTISGEPYDDSAVVVDVDLANATVSVSGTYTYTGAPQTPSADALTVTVDGKTVPSDAYTVQASDNVNAGTATVTVTAKDGSGYTGSVTGTFTIGKATPQVSVSPSDSQVFPSTPLEDIEKNLQVTSNVKGALALGDAELTVGENALTWTFTPEDSANYETVAGTLTLTVSEDTVTSIAITTPPTKTSYAYGEAFDPAGMVVTATYASGATSEVALEDLSFSPAELAVGTTQVSVTYEGMSATVDVAVNPRSVAPALELTDAEGLVYTGAEQEPGVVAKDGDVVIPTSEYVVTYANNVNAGTATVTVADAPGGNYEVDTATTTFKIAPARPTLSVSAAEGGAPYGSPVTLALTLEGVAGETPSATATVTVDGTEHQVAITDGAGALELDGLEVGEHAVSVLVPAAGNYEAATATASLLVRKATPQVTVAEVDPDLVVYPTTDRRLIEANYAAQVDPEIEGTLSVELPASLTPGDHECAWTFTPADTKNYEVVRGTVTLTVTEDALASIAVTTPPTKTAYTYGETFDPAGMVVTATWASGRTADVSGAVSFDAALEVGQTEVELAYASGGRTATCTVPVTVSARAVTPTLALTGAEGLVYTGALQEPGVVAKDGDVVIPTSEYVVTYEDNVDAGTATVTVTDAPGGNYEVATATTTFEIARAQAALSVSAQTEGAVVGDAVTLSVSLTGAAGQGLDGTVTVSVDGTDREVAVAGGAGTLTLEGLDEARTYEVAASFAGAANYEPATASTSFSLAKDTPEVSVAYVGGQIFPTTPLSEVEKNLQVTSDVPGTLSLDATELQVGTHDYAWTFTPADPAAYNEVTGSVTLTVSRDALTGIELTSAPAKTAYTYGESFDPTGMTVTATYASGRTADVTALVSFERALAVGQTSVTLTFADGADVATAEVGVTVAPRAVSPTLELAGADGLVYNGQTQEPVVSVLVDGEPLSASEYVVTYANNVNAGTATVTVTDAPGGNYEVATATTTFEIARAHYGIEVPDLDVTFDGTPVDLTTDDVTVIGYGQEVLVSLSWQELTEDGWRQLDAAPSEVGSYRLVVTVTSEDPNYEPTTERAFEFSILAPAEETPDPGDGDQGGDQGGTRPGDAQTPGGTTPGTPAPGGSGHATGALPGTGDPTTLGATLGALLTGGLASVAAAVRSLRRRS